MDIETGKGTGYSHTLLSSMKYRMAARCIAMAEIVAMLGAFIYWIFISIYIGFTNGISRYSFNNDTALYIFIGFLVLIVFGVLPFFSAVGLLKSTSSTDNQDISRKRSHARFWYLYTIFLLVLGIIGMTGIGIVFIYHGFGAFAFLAIVLRYGSMLAIAIVPVYFVKKYINELEYSIQNDEFVPPVPSLTHSRF